jgi:hypothetical protein
MKALSNIMSLAGLAVSLNSNSLGAFPPGVRGLVSPPGQYSSQYQLYVDPLLGRPVPQGSTAGHFSLSDLITLVNGRAWFENAFSIFNR